jgi:tetrahydromethanopterin S-methyltransferase subunit G
MKSKKKKIDLSGAGFLFGVILGIILSPLFILYFLILNLFKRKK